MAENVTDERPGDARPTKGPTCNVNSTFNYSVDAVSVAVGGAAIYAAYKYLIA